MENLISKQLLAQVRNESFNESIQILTKAEKKKERDIFSFEISIFLSHKHDEKEIIQEVITLLNKLGVDVYVDWLDYEMPKNTNGYTAKRIKEKIRKNDKFILLATEAAISSKWCNWELGYGDACKYHKNIAIMPITEKEGSQFSGSEYLQIYPIITSKYLYYSGTYFVEYQDEKISLQDWLRQK